MFSRNQTSLRPDQLNEHDQVIDEKILRRDRFRFGLCTILNRSEENAMGGIPSVLIRALGGNAFAVGMFSAFQGLSSISQFVGPLILQRTRSNQKALIISMYIGAILAGLIVVSILGAHLGFISPALLWTYLILSAGFAAAGGIQLNIENSWIGDLVPRNKLGWFCSYKWILACFGMIISGVTIGRIADWSPSCASYAAVYALFGLSFLWAAYVYRRITDRAPKNVTFIKSGIEDNQRIDYTYFPMWCYITFFWCWSGSRVAFGAFMPLYLIDQFNCSMTNIAWLVNAQLITSMVLMHFLGRLGDRIGHRVPLIAISCTAAASMSLWVGSAWLGIVPIIIYEIINGVAGATHSMVSINLALEIFPDKGRAAYFAFTNICIGAVTMLTPALGGIFLRSCKDVHFQLWGATLNNYHFLFAGCTLLAMCCVIPLVILGRFTAKEEAHRKAAGMTV